MTDAPATLDEATLAFAEQVFEAARTGDTERLRQWFTQGLTPNLRNHKGDSLLMLASYHGHLEATALLLEQGADPSLVNQRGHTPLAGAAFKGNAEMIELLLSFGADVEGVCADGKSALMMATMFNHTQVMQQLKDAGANIYHQDIIGAGLREAAQLTQARDALELLTRWGV